MIFSDIRHGARMLRTHASFTIIAIVSIAIGVGANAAMFSVADGLVLRPLPVPHPGDIVTVSSIVPRGGPRFPVLSYPEYQDVRDRARSFDDLVAYRLVITGVSLNVAETVERRVGAAVTANLFDAMQVRPLMGRTFRPDEDRVVGRDAVVVLDYDEWREQFGGRADIVDTQIRIGGVTFTVIGVMPDAFTGIDHDVRPAFYVPVSMYPAVQNGASPEDLTARARRGLTVKGRLKSGVTLAQAQADLARVGRDLERTYPDTNRNRTYLVQTQFQARADAGGGTDASLVLMLITLAVTVLLVACANVAGLLMSRVPARSREIALRLAMGARRGRLIQQLIVESLLIAAGGGLLGLALGYLVVVAFQQLEIPTDLPLKLTFRVDGRVVAVAMAAATLGTIAASLFPAWKATRTDLLSVIKDPNATASRGPRLWGRSTLVCAQVALSLVLLTVSAFLYGAFTQALNRGPGFRTTNLLMMTFEPGLQRYDRRRAAEFYRLLEERALATPGVTAVALTSSVPMKTSTIRFSAVAPEGVRLPAGVENVGVSTSLVDPTFFDTLSIPISSGRSFRDTDTTTAPLVAIVNQTFASHYWPGENAVGKRIRLDDEGHAFAEVVGVASNAKYFFIVEGPVDYVYLPLLQHRSDQATLLVATRGSDQALVSPLREVVRSIDPNMPVFGVRTMENFYGSRTVDTTRLIIGSVMGMGAMGLALAMAGLYALVSYAAGRRTREIGIRMAVGADRGSVLRMVLRHALVLACGGTAVGLLGSVAANTLLKRLFADTAGMSLETQHIDVTNYVVLVPALFVVVMLAAYFPARRAAAIDPMTALRIE